MPGITGYIRRNPEVPGTILDQMVASLTQESGCLTGQFRNEALGLAVGWVSQASSFAAYQPAGNGGRDCCLIFHGEDYGGALQHVLARYETQGVQCFDAINGIFSGVLVDSQARKVVLFNDRYGLSRVYWHENRDGFYFASEAKALLQVLPHLRRMDARGLGEYVTCGCTLENQTLFPGLSLLPGAAAWEFSPGGDVRKRAYFDPTTWMNQEPLAAPVYYPALRETFKRVAPRYLRAPQPVALSLTGGVDCRMVLAAAHPPPGTLPCYTFGGMLRECADVRIARKVARVSRQPYQVLALTPDFFTQFPQLARDSVYRTDGAMDVSGATGLFLNRLAREVAPIRLTGNYGGEILRGLVPFRPRYPREGLFHPELRPHLEAAAATYAAQRQGHRVGFVAFKQVPWHHYARFALEQSVLTLRTPFLDNELVALAHRAPPAPVGDKGPARRLIAEWQPALGRIATDRGWSARLTWLPRRMQRFCTEFLPRAEYVYDYGMPQWLVRMDRFIAPLHLERLFLGHQKYAYYRLWYRNQLSAFVKAVLLDSQTLSRPYLNGRFVEKMVRDHVTGRGNYTLEIHKLLTTEMIERHLIAHP